MISINNKRDAKFLWDVAKYLHKSFSIFSTVNKDVEHVFIFLSKHYDRFIYIEENRKIVGLACYYMLEDSTIEGIKNGLLDLYNVETHKKFLNEDGNNLHFFSLCTTKKDLILKGFRFARKELKPKSISWIKPDLKTFRYFNCKEN